MYRLNQIPLKNYGITAGRAPLSNIALSGFLDMPERLGKTFHDWLDEEGVEPYVDADELFYGSRTITFYGYITADDQQEAIFRLRELYDDYGRLTDLIALNTPYGIFNVYLKDEINARYLGNGAAAIEMVFEQPDVPMPNHAIPEPTTINRPHIDFIPLSAFKAVIEQTDGQLNRPELKQASFTAYNTTGYQLTKVGPLDVTLNMIFSADTFNTLKEGIERLHQVLANSGTRVINIDDTERDSFAVNGFTVSGLRIFSGRAVARLRVRLVMAFDGRPVVTPWLRDNGNEGVKDVNGNFIAERPLPEVFLFDQLERKVLDKNLNPIKL